MKNFFPKFVTVLLITTIVILFVSCSNEENIENPFQSTSANDILGENDDSNTSETELAPNLPDIQYDNYEFKILHDVKGWGTYAYEYIVPEDLNGEILNDTIYNRNRTIEDQYGVVISAVINDNVSNELNRVVMAGEDEYDVAMVTYGLARGTDMLIDFNTVPYIDLSMPWWDQNIKGSMTVGGVCTNVLSDFMVTHKDGTVAMFFNKKIATDYNLENMYDLVREGKWTIDKFHEMAAQVSHDLDGDNTYTDTDLYGYSAIPSNSYLYMLFGVGGTFTENDENDIPVLTINTESFITRYSKVLDILGADDYFYSPANNKNAGGDGDQSIFRVFIEDRALFLSHGIGSSNRFRDMESDFGILPAPKYNDAQENYINIVDAGKYMVIPKTVSDLSRTGVILEALSYESYKNVVPAYYDVMLKNKFMRDLESIEMLDEYVFPNSKMKGYYSSDFQSVIQPLRDSGMIVSAITANEEMLTNKVNTGVESMLKSE